MRISSSTNIAALLRSSLVVKKRLITWRQAFPLSLLERYGRGNDQARRRTLWTKWANTSQLLNRNCYYASLTLNTNLTFFTLTREMLQCECELISQSARSFSLERQAAAVRKIEQWTLMLADKAALMSSWRDASDNFTKQASPVKTSGLQEERGSFPATAMGRAIQ